MTKNEIVNLTTYYKINNLLRKLRTKGKIGNTTVAGNKSTWALVND